MFKTCPISQGINAAALFDERQSERQEAISERADDLMCMAESADLVPLLDDVIGGIKGKDIIVLMAQAVKTYGDDRRQAVYEMFNIIEDELKKAFEPKAKEQLDAGLDAWGDAE